MFIGVDVATAELVMSIVPAAERFTVANDERGCARWSNDSARSTGRLAKTDRIGAEILARFAEVVRPAVHRAAHSPMPVDHSGSRERVLAAPIAFTDRRAAMSAATIR